MAVVAAAALVAAFALAPLAAVGATVPQTRHEPPPVPPEAGAVATKPSGDAFGPDRCVELGRTEAGTCTFRTSCGSANLSNVEFAFVCFNPGTTVPHALHSFGRGGFAAEEEFDTEIPCTQCASVDTAFSTGGPVVRAALQSLAKSGEESQEVAEKATPRDPVESPKEANLREPVESPKEAPPREPVESPLSSGETGELREAKPAEAAFYGPKNCIATFRSPSYGTCIIQTRCIGADLSAFNVGVTCLDASAAYSRYLFGRGVFEAEEIFDTRIECELCLGVGDGDPATQQLTGALPKQLLEDVSSLKSEVQLLKEELGAILRGLPLDSTDGGSGNGTNATGQSAVATPSPAVEAEATSKPAVEVEATTVPPTTTTTEALAPAPSLARAPAHLRPGVAATTTPTAEVEATTSASIATDVATATTTAEALAPAPAVAATTTPAAEVEATTSEAPSSAPPSESSTTPLVAAPAGPPPKTPEAETTTPAASLAPAPAARAAAPASALARLFSARVQPPVVLQDAAPAAADVEDTLARLLAARAQPAAVLQDAAPALADVEDAPMAARAAAPAATLARLFPARVQPAAVLQDASLAVADVEDTPVVLHHRPSAYSTTHSLRELLAGFAS